MNNNGQRVLGASPASSSDIVRDINRRVVLNFIRTRHPISRAELSRVTGLQRSTISLIVDQLIEEEWVVEGATGRLPRGRRPTFLHLNTDRIIVGVDIRPTDIRVALADANGRFNSQENFSTPRDPETATQELIRSIQRLLQASAGNKSVEGIGISLPGRFDEAENKLVFAPNLGWSGYDIRSPIQNAIGMDVTLENAANACVLAAIWFDGLDVYRNLVVVTVSEGIGAGILVNDQLVRGLNGMAGEFGHVVLDPRGPACSCGNRGCWETMGSNRAALRYYLESNTPHNGFSFGDLLSLAEQGDSHASKALQAMAKHFGQGLRTIVTGLAPECIVVIGDLTRLWSFFEPLIKTELETHVVLPHAIPRIIPGRDGAQARLRGTIALVLQKHFAPAP